MIKILVVAFVAVVMIGVGVFVVSALTPRYGPFDNTEVHKPFPGLTLSIHKSYIYDEKRIVGTIKDKKCEITITSTDDNSYRVEFWQVRYRAKDVKAKDAILKTPIKEVILNMVKKNKFICFHRIECYASIGGKVKHKTIEHKFFSHW